MSATVHRIGVGFGERLECPVKVIANQVGSIAYEAAVSKATAQGGMQVINLRATQTG